MYSKKNKDKNMEVSMDMSYYVIDRDGNKNYYPYPPWNWQAIIYKAPEHES